MIKVQIAVNHISYNTIEKVPEHLEQLQIWFPFLPFVLRHLFSVNILHPQILTLYNFWHGKMKMVENMKNRKSFIGIVSIILPPLALFLGLPVLIKFSEKIYFDDFFSNFRLKLLYWGWIVGLIAGVKGLKETSMSRNEGIVRIILKCVSILGIVINCFLKMLTNSK